MATMNMTDTILCPNCSYSIEVSAALAGQVREQLRKEHDAELHRHRADLQREADTLREREQALEQSQRRLEQQVSERVAQALGDIEQQAAVAAEAQVALNLRDLNNQLAEATAKLGEAQQAELQLRKERRDLEEQKREQELTLLRTLDEEREKIRLKTACEADEKHRLAEADKEKVISDLRLQIDVLKRRAEQGSMQVQGEVMELDLEAMLRSTFPQDEFEPVAVGVHGGDIKQHVRDRNGQDCGTILWEAKRTKAWNDGWLPKLREDQRASHAEAAVLLSIELPKGLTTFAFIDGVWVTSRGCLGGLAMALRLGLIEATRAHRSAEGRQEKTQLLHAYVSGPEFRQRVEGIADPLATMRDDLESEKRSFARHWKRREKQLDRAIVNTACLYGEVDGIMGGTIPKVAHLELPNIASDDAEAEAEEAVAAE
jgi:hypothetical protein